MALAGSTRMQASTVLMLAVGLALFFPQSERMKSAFVDYRDHYATIDLQAQPQFIEAESKVYQDGGHLLYHAEELAIAVFTDTTERAPTFSLSPFDNQKFPRSRHSLSYVIIDSAGSSRESWHRLLARPARPLNWGPEYPQTNEDYMEGFDFGQGGADYRRQAIPGAHEDFTILKSGQEIVWSFKGLEARFPSDLDHELFDHLLLKQLLNIHSTLIMGRLNRYQMNFMTWVVPTNGKLVDRASRYVSWLLEDSGMGSVNYEDIVRELFVQQEKLQPQESVVLKTFEALKEILK